MSPYNKKTMLSSSPRLPSPSRLYSIITPQMTRDSEAEPTSNTIIGFRSAASLLQRDSCINEKVCGTSRVQKGHDICKTKWPKKADVKVVDTPTSDILNTRVDADDLYSGEQKLQKTKEDSPTKSASRKPRARKSDARVQKQTTIKKAKITKPGAERAAPETKSVSNKSKRVKVKSRSTLSTLLDNDKTTIASRETCELNLEEAVKRKLDWTPTKDTKALAREQCSERVLSSAQICGEGRLGNGNIGTLLSSFKVSVPENRHSAVFEDSRSSNPDGIVKRRKLELLSGLGALASPAEKPLRSRSPRKKPRTITEKATAPFVPPQVESGSSLLQYLDPPTVPESDAKSARNATSNSAPKKATKAKSLAKARKKESIVLLSPETALKKARDQELIFGTSSQLVRDESPTFLRDLQQAMKDSERPKDSQGKDHDSGAQQGNGKSSVSSNKTPSKNLWSAASRDLEDELLQADIIDLTHTPMQPKFQSGSQLDQAKPDGQQGKAIEFLVDETIKRPVTTAHEFNALIQEQPTAFTNILPCSIAESALKARTTFASPDESGNSTSLPSPNIPNFQGYSEAQLKKQVASYGFKAIKKREAMIALLERCWESQKNTALQERPGAINHAQPIRAPLKKAARAMISANDPSSPPPKRPRGRPKKDPSIVASPTKKKARSKKTVPSAMPDDEMSDDLKTPRASPKCKIKSSKELGDASAVSVEPVPVDLVSRLKPRQQNLQLLDQITVLITTFQPNHEAGNLTWYEKMLMYEPIVIEDLAAWLCRKSDGKVTNDKDGFEMVKSWCEARSVCCVWKENLRGGQRGRW